MKKAMSLFLALVLVAVMVVPVFADGNTTTLTTVVPSAEYTLTIPADMVIPFNTFTTTIGDVVVTAASGFSTGKNVNVYVTHDAFTSEEVDTTIPYALVAWVSFSTSSGTKNVWAASIEDGAPLVYKGQSDGSLRPTDRSGSENPASTQAPTGTLYKTTYLEFTAKDTDWAKALAGTYSSHITFTAEIVSG